MEGFEKGLGSSIIYFPTLIRSYEKINSKIVFTIQFNRFDLAYLDAGLKSSSCCHSQMQQQATIVESLI